MAQIKWSLTASYDLQEIEDYIARDSPLYAVRVTNRIVEAVERLEEFPRSGRIVPEYGNASLREVIEGSYRIVYTWGDEVITVLRVVHAARDFERVVGFDLD